MKKKYCMLDLIHDLKGVLKEIYAARQIIIMIIYLLCQNIRTGLHSYILRYSCSMKILKKSSTLQVQEQIDVTHFQIFRHPGPGRLFYHVDCSTCFVGMDISPGPDHSVHYWRKPWPATARHSSSSHTSQILSAGWLVGSDQGKCVIVQWYPQS